MWLDEPFIGQGYLAYRELGPAFGDPFMGSPHNEWLRFFAEEGDGRRLCRHRVRRWQQPGRSRRCPGGSGPVSWPGFLGYVIAASFNNPLLFIRVSAVAFTIVGRRPGPGGARAEPRRRTGRRGRSGDRGHVRPRAGGCDRALDRRGRGPGLDDPRLAGWHAALHWPRMPISLLRIVGSGFRGRRSCSWRSGGSDAAAPGAGSPPAASSLIGLGLVRRRARSRTSSDPSRTCSAWRASRSAGSSPSWSSRSRSPTCSLSTPSAGPTAPTSASAGSSGRCRPPSSNAARGAAVGRRARLHPRLRRGRQPAGGPRRGPDRGRRPDDPRPRHRRRLTRRHRDGRPRRSARTSSATRSTAARARRSRPATSSPSGSASRSS